VPQRAKPQRGNQTKMERYVVPMEKKLFLKAIIRGWFPVEQKATFSNISSPFKSLDRLLEFDGVPRKRRTELILMGTILPLACIYFMSMLFSFIEYLQLGLQVILFGLGIGFVASYLYTRRELNALQTKGQLKRSVLLTFAPVLFLACSIVAFIPVSFSLLMYFFCLSFSMGASITHSLLNLRWEKISNSVQYTKGRLLFSFPK